MIYHVLPGDSTLEQFKLTGLEGDVIICREAFIVGPTSAQGEELWAERAAFMLSEYGEDEIGYQEHAAREIERIHDVEDGDEVNLWFEYELFCSVNLWYFLTQLTNAKAEVYRVHPATLNAVDRWKGFGSMPSGELKSCFEQRIPLGSEDLELGRELWSAFGARDGERLRRLGSGESPAFPYLAEVCSAAAEVETAPSEILAEIRFEGRSEFGDIFAEFSKRAGVYGLGDLQVERILEKLDQ